MDGTVVVEVSILHNTVVNNLTLDNLLFDALLTEFFLNYGEYYYGLDYVILEDGMKVMEERSIPTQMYFFRLPLSRRVYLINGRLRSVDLYPENATTFHYKQNKNMKPDWRNQRWTNQQLQHEEKDPVVVVGTRGCAEVKDHHRGSTFGFSNVVNAAPMEFSLYAVRRSSVLYLCRSFLMEIIRSDPQVVSFLTDSTTKKNVSGVNVNVNVNVCDVNVM